MTFSDLGLADALLKAIAEQGYANPTPVQEKGIPPILAGKDVMAAAQTGTGKTAGFTLPILQRLSGKKRAKGNGVRALILTPTRELAIQVAESVKTYSKHMDDMKSDVVYGGVKVNPQMLRLRGGADILVATPGRLMDLYQQNAVHFRQLEILVLDEADRMLDMGFIHDIRKILALLPKDRQTLMFSATFSDDIRNLAKGMIRDPVEFSVTPRNATATSVEQCIYLVDKKQKSHALSFLIGSNNWRQVLVFSRTKHGANKLTTFLEKSGIHAAAIHGNKSQGARIKALADFKAGKVRALVATDIAARGIDIDQLPQVVNFDLPNVPEDYVHRIGRTGRAGSTGHAVSLVSADEDKQLFDIERLIGKKIERRTIDGFEPTDTPADRELTPQRKPGRNKKRPSQNRGNQPEQNKPSANKQPGDAARRPRRQSGSGGGTNTSSNTGRPRNAPKN